MSPRAGKTSLLFVCTGNLCRSPLAHGIALKLAADHGRFSVDSAGTDPPRVGIPPVTLAIEVAQDHGIDISGLKTRAFEPADFQRADVILTMDLGQYDLLRFLQPPDTPAQLALLTSYIDPSGTLEVADPFGKSKEHFEQAFDLIERSVVALVNTL